eukprot:gene44328-29679_t
MIFGNVRWKEAATGGVAPEEVVELPPLEDDQDKIERLLTWTYANVRQDAPDFAAGIEDLDKMMLGRCPKYWPKNRASVLAGERAGASPHSATSPSRRRAAKAAW